MHRVQGAGGHRHPAPQRQLLRRALPAPVPRPGGARPSRTSTCSSPTSGRSSPCRAARTRWPCGTSSSSSATRPTASTSVSASATTATRPARWPAPSPSSAGLHLHRGRPARRTTASTSRPAPRRPGGCRARRAGCPSATCSTRPPAPAATTCVVTGHNLDDEAAVLFGNVLHWQTDYLGRQLPVLPGPQRLPAQGEAAGPPRRAGDGRVLRAPRHRLHRRGVPDGRRQQAPRLQGGAQRHRGHVARARKHDFYFGFLARASERFTPEAEDEQEQLRRVRAAAARRPPARCARSAAWSSGPPRCPVELGRKAPPMSRAVRGRRAGAAHRHEEAPLPAHAHGGQGVPLPLRHRRPRRGDRLRRGHRVPLEPRDDLHRHPPDAGRLRAEDAARRAGDLSEGPRPDPAARRHLPGRAGARVRRRLGRAVDDAAARRRRRSSATSCREDFAARAAKNVAALPRRSAATATGSSTATATRASTRPTSTGSCSTCPSRGRW